MNEEVVAVVGLNEIGRIPRLNPGAIRHGDERATHIRSKVSVIQREKLQREVSGSRFLSAKDV